MLPMIKSVVLTLGFALLLISSSIQAEISIKDIDGKLITLEKPAKSIISLAPHITELVFAVGAGKQLVGAVSFSNYPEEALKVPLVGSYNKVSYESIAGINPDLILAWKSGNGEEMIKKLRSLGFTVYVHEPQTLKDVAESMLTIGHFSGHASEAQLAHDNFITKLNRLKTTFSAQKPVSVFYQVWNDPRLTINDDHLIADVIRLCGGRNVFADAMVLTPKVNVETVIRRNPEAIIASGMAQERPEWLDEWRAMPTMTAVANEQLYFIPPDLLQRHSPRILDGADMMCEFINNTRQVITASITKQGS